MQYNPQLKSLKVIFVVLLLAIGLASWFEYRPNAAGTGTNINRIGNHVGKWEGIDHAISDKDKGPVVPKDSIIRTYRAEGENIYLVVIREAGDRHRVHSPVDCYTGSGWTVLNKKTIPFGGDQEKPVRRMEVIKNPLSRLVYYWFEDGKDRSASFKGHLFLYFRNVLLNRENESWVYFQVSADIIEDLHGANARIEDFITGLEQLRLFAT